MKNGQSCAAEIPTRHSDFGDIPSSDVLAAARWAWSRLLSLERIFCETYGMGMYSTPLFGDVPDESKWRDAQDELHHAMAFVGGDRLGFEGCAACAVVSAMAKMVMDPYLPEQRVLAADDPNVQCHRFKECGAGQSILMSLDLEDLPVMPPWKSDEINRIVKPAQRVGQRLLDLIAEFTPKAPSRPAPKDVETALEYLLNDITMHRLTFLFFADVCSLDLSRPGIQKSSIPGWRNLEMSIESSGNFLIRDSHVVEIFARVALKQFGAVPDETLCNWASTDTYWRLAEDGCQELDRSSKALMKACAAVRALDSRGAYTEVLLQVMNVIHDNKERPRWYPPDKISWGYLQRLDRAIHTVNTACMGLHDLHKSVAEAGKEFLSEAPLQTEFPQEEEARTDHSENPTYDHSKEHRCIVVDYVRKDDGWHWFIDGQDKGTAGKRESTKIRKVSSILLDQAGMGWIPHETFMNATGWKPGAYFDKTGHTGTMQRLLTNLRALGLKIEFEKDKGVRLGDGKVNYQKHSRISF